jgi:hypothetical protein
MPARGTHARAAGTDGGVPPQVPTATLAVCVRACPQ